MSVISNLVERTVRSTSIRSPSALFATERGRDARTYAGETSAHPGGAWASETRAPGCHLCGRDARAPRRRLGGRDPRTRLSLMRARRPRTQAALGRARPAHLVVTYAGETPALPGGAWAGATRGGRCVNDLRAAFQDAPGRCAREPMTARCRTWGARHAVPLSFVIETTICGALAETHPIDHDPASPPYPPVSSLKRSGWYDPAVYSTICRSARDRAISHSFPNTRMSAIRSSELSNCAVIGRFASQKMKADQNRHHQDLVIYYFCTI